LDKKIGGREMRDIKICGECQYFKGDDFDYGDWAVGSGSCFINKKDVWFNDPICPESIFWIDYPIFLFPGYTDRYFT
jgi:hypothetical protein